MLTTCGISVLLPQNSVSYSHADRHALGTPKEYERTVNVLAEYLTSPFFADEMKVRAIFRWVTQNIEHVFEGSVTLGAGKVVIFGQYAVDGQFQGLVEFLSE